MAATPLHFPALVALTVLTGCGLREPRLAGSGYTVTFPAIPTHMQRTEHGKTANIYDVTVDKAMYMAIVVRAPYRVHLDEPLLTQSLSRYESMGQPLQYLATIPAEGMSVREARFSGPRGYTRARVIAVGRYLFLLSVTWGPGSASEPTFTEEFLTSFRPRSASGA